MLEQLARIAQEDPDDPFNHYALALEYMKTDVQRARAIFEQLIDKYGNYVPTYYQLGQLYAELGLSEQAISTFEKGIGVARETGDLKTMRELDGARLAILYDN
jgi:tetratricopeptide (TPR) repeat protein